MQVLINCILLTLLLSSCATKDTAGCLCHAEGCRSITAASGQAATTLAPVPASASAPIGR